jgi:hypothetical protein
MQMITVLDMRPDKSHYAMIGDMPSQPVSTFATFESASFRNLLKRLFSLA